jgi:hypothetical protein
MGKIRHDEIKTYSIIDTPLWEKAKWMGFGFLVHPIERLGIVLAYENLEAGIEIFKKWINKLGNEDKAELIKITIIKGVDKNNPYWYRVNISSNLDNIFSSQPDNYIVVSSRSHQMEPTSPDNLNNLIALYNAEKKYKLYPAKISDNNIMPYFDKSILKTTLTIKEAWEIGEHDLERTAINENDSPIIPEHIKDAPILKVLNSDK